MKKSFAQSGFSGIIILVVILLIALIGYSFYYFGSHKAGNTLKNDSTTAIKTQSLEIAKRTFFKNNQVVSTIEEKNQKNSDGSLLTTLTSNDKELSQQLFFNNIIFRLSDGVLQVQNPTVSHPTTYLTNAENILKYIRQSNTLAKQDSVINGHKVTIYSIGGKQAASMGLISSVFADDTDSTQTNVQIDQETGKLVKIEALDTSSNQIQETIEYQSGPVQNPPPYYTPEPALTPSPIPPTPTFVPSPQETPSDNLPTLSMEDQLKYLGEKLLKEQAANAEVVNEFNQMKDQTTQTTVVTVTPAIVPDGAIYMNPMTMIPTASGYNSPIIELSSNLFNQQSRQDQAIKQTGVFEALKFAQQNLKIRIDGNEIKNPNIDLAPVSNGSTTEPWKVHFSVPSGLTPGYHSVDVFVVDSWYLAPNILVALPRADEKVVETELFVNPPPMATKLANNQGYKVTLQGKNFIKPLTVLIDEVRLDDQNIEVVGTDQLVLTIPANIPAPKGPAYDVTILKDGQKVFRPSFLILGATPPSQ